ncbi:uncharacterized protein LOC115232858 [Formica exsecta]|uniref:uncharacterized protein LOC115232858 n=1 Tax=Formica exsecta TaxID=72781 RepID=UPI001144CE60|nr:uncharacterized protein LOC115232858 [Formica exsecta]
MDTRTGESGGEPAATILDNNTGIATTAGPLAESSTSSSSSSSSPSASSSSSAVAPTVILTESTATNAGNLSLTGSSQQQSLHQVHQQQQTRQRVNLIADVAANDVTDKNWRSYNGYRIVEQLPGDDVSTVHFSIFINENFTKYTLRTYFKM